jgi:hypothetical protein
MRRHRQRLRDARLAEWRSSHPKLWHPFLEAWAQRGLHHPPSSGQLRELEPAARYMGGSHVAAAVLRGAPAWTWRAPEASTYTIVGRVLARLARFVREGAGSDWRLALAGEAGRPWRPFDDGLPLWDVNAKRERGEGKAPEPPPQAPPIPLPPAEGPDPWCRVCSRPTSVCRCR